MPGAHERIGAARWTAANGGCRRAGDHRGGRVRWAGRGGSRLRAPGRHEETRTSVTEKDALDASGVGGQARRMRASGVGDGVDRSTTTARELRRGLLDDSLVALTGRGGRGSPNSRHGATPKTFLTEVGKIPISTPRDRSAVGTRPSLAVCCNRLASASRPVLEARSSHLIATVRSSPPCFRSSSVETVPPAGRRLEIQSIGAVTMRRRRGLGSLGRAWIDVAAGVAVPRRNPRGSTDSDRAPGTTSRYQCRQHLASGGHRHCASVDSR